MSYLGERLRKTTGYRIPKEFYNLDKNELKFTRKNLSNPKYEGIEIKKIYERYKDEIDNIIKSINSSFENYEKEYKINTLKHFWMLYSKNKLILKNKEEITLRDFFDRYKKKINNNPSNTIGIFNRLEAKLNKIGILNQIVSNIEMEDIELIRDYFYIPEKYYEQIFINGELKKDFLNNVTERNSNNYVERLLNCLRIVVNYSVRLGTNNINLVNHITNVKSNINTFDSPVVALTIEEFEKLKTTELANNILEVARLKLIFMISTGQRKSDYGKINLTKDTDNKDIWKLNQKKGGVDVIIPINSYLKEILEKLDYNIYIDSNLNHKFKAIADILGFEREIHDFKDNYGNKETKILKNVLSLHATRRSFVTIAYAKTKNLYGIMAITGHKNEKEILKYLNINHEQKQSIIDLF